MVKRELRIWDVKLKIESPMVIARRRTSSGFADPLRYIPSTTLRGAIISALYREGIIDRQRIEQESRDPELVASPAYPFKNGHKLYPSPPLLQECKKCKELVGYTNLHTLEERLRSGEDPEIAIECPSGHRALKSLHPGEFLQVRRGGIFALPSKGQGCHEPPYTMQAISVAISKGRGSSIKGLLYSYEAISPGNEYWATIAAPDDIDPPANGLPLMIGRGVSRGLGRASLMVERRRSIESIDVDSRHVLLYALSPTTGYSAGGTYPASIDLTSVASRTGTAASGMLEIERVYGRTVWVSGGWDMARGWLRPRILGRAQGSLLYGRIEPEDAAASAGLAALSCLGVPIRIGENTLVGLNLLIPVEVLGDAS